MKCYGLPRLSVDWPIQTKRIRILVSAVRVSLKGGLWSRPWGLARQLVSRNGSSSGGAHRTGWCEFKDLQAACCLDRLWGSNSTEQSGKRSTVLCMILLIRTITMSLQLQRGGKSTMEKWWEIANYLKLKGSMETNCSRYHPSVLTKSLLLGIFPSTLNR